MAAGRLGQGWADGVELPKSVAFLNKALGPSLVSSAGFCSSFV